MEAATAVLIAAGLDAFGNADLEAATVSVRRSAGMVRDAGGGEVREGDTRSGKPRVVDLDDGAAAVLRSWKRERGAVALPLVTVPWCFGDIEGRGRSTRSGVRQCG